jgi:hypothetical protein
MGLCCSRRMRSSTPASGSSWPGTRRCNGSGRAGSPTRLGAVDVALWDLRAKHAGLPLWRFLGGASSPRVSAYNTDVGWLSIPTDQLRDGVCRAVEEEGFRAVKLKVGHGNPGIDLERLAVVRRAVGSDITIAIDGTENGTCRPASGSAPGLRAWTCSGSKSPCGTMTLGRMPRWRAPRNPDRARRAALLARRVQELRGGRGVQYVQPDVTRLGRDHRVYPGRGSRTGVSSSRGASCR